MIDLSCLSAVHPLAAAVAERCKLLGAGIAKRIPAVKDALIDRLALAAAGADKMVWRHCFPSFSLYISIIYQQKEGLIRFIDFQAATLSNRWI